MGTEQECPRTGRKFGSPVGVRAAVIGTGAVSVLGVLVGIVTSSLLARALGPRGRGEYAAVLNWPNFIADLGMVGLHPATVYFSAADPEHADAWRANALWMMLVGWIVSSAACWFAVPWLLAAQSSDTVTSARLFGAVYGLGLAGWSAGLGGLQGRCAFKAWNALRGAQLFLWLLVLGTWVFLGFRSVRLMALSYGATFIVLGSVALLLKQQSETWSFNGRLARRLLSYGLPAVVALLPGVLNRKLDQLLMATLVSPEVLGLYAAAVTITVPLAVIATPVANVIMPSITGVEGASQRASLLGRTARATTLVLVLTALLLTASVPVIVPLVFGERFRDAIGPARILTVAAVLVGLVTVLETALMGLGCLRATLKAELCGLIVTTAGLAVTLPRWPLFGAATTSFIAYGASLWIMTRECHRALGLSPRDLFRPGSAEWMLILDVLKSLPRRLHAMTRRSSDSK